MLQHMQTRSIVSTNPGRSHIINLLDHFHHRRSDKDHVCLVFPVMGHHLGLQGRNFEQQRIPVAVMKEVARQLLQGLDFLHLECGIIHTGISHLIVPSVVIPLVKIYRLADHKYADLKPSNILLELKSPESVILSYLQQTSPRTSHERLGDVESRSAIPTPLSEDITTPLLAKPDDVHVRIIDFGVCGFRISSSALL